MEAQDTKGKIIRETFPSEVISIVGDIFAGIILSILILPFESFLLLILIIPPLLSLRGNITAPFIARTARDLIIGEFNIRKWFENVLATYFLSLITATLIGFISLLLDLVFFRIFLLSIPIMIFIPVISISLTLSISIPISTILNYFIFRYGLNPNNIVNPVMTAIGDFSMVICFYLTIIILGVP
ncbi:MAG: magnesium transporter [Candidatus Heimdallarchaeota archaeon]